MDKTGWCLVIWFWHIPLCVHPVWRNTLNRIPILRSKWGWAQMIPVGVAFVAVDEYLLGLLVLLCAAISLLATADSAKGRLPRFLCFVSSLAVTLLAVHWTLLRKGNEPWSNLLHRNDFTVQIVSGLAGKFPFSDGHLDYFLFAKRETEQRIVTPITVAALLRINNLGRASRRIDNWRAWLRDESGDTVELIAIPTEFKIYQAFGYQVEFNGNPYLSDELRAKPINGGDFLQGVVVFDSDDPNSRLHGRCVMELDLTDANGEHQTATTMPFIAGEHNLSRDFELRVLSGGELDPRMWLIQHYAQKPF